MEIVVELAPGSEDNRFLARVVSSPAGESTDDADFVLPWNQLQQPERLPSLCDALSGKAPAGDSARHIGEALFDALFQGEIRDLYHDSRGQARGAGMPLHVRLRVRPGQRDMARILSLPWELLSHPLGQGFLSLRGNSQIIRSLLVPAPLRPSTLPPDFRILVAVAPAQDLDWERETQSLEGDFEGTERLLRLETTDLSTLRAALMEHKPHVLHMIGHGSFTARALEGWLALGGSPRRQRKIRGRDLAAKVTDFPDLQLVVINACSSGHTPHREDVKPFASVGASLVQYGLSVVAMQCPITSGAAIAFSNAFYDQLQEGASVERAMAEGRQAIHSLKPDSLEWAVPVLFLRDPAAKTITELPRWWRPMVRVSQVVLVLAVLALVAVTLGAPIQQKRARERARDVVQAGLLQFQERRIEAALQTFEKAIRTDPEYPPGHVNKAQVLRELGHLEEALESLEKAVQLDPEDASSRYNLGTLLADLGRPWDALDQFREALRLEPTHAKTYNEMGRAYWELELYEEAREILTAGLHARSFDMEHPGDRIIVARLHKNLGRILLELDDLEAAVSHLETAVREYGEDDFTGTAEARLVLARARFAQVDPERGCVALRWFRQEKRAEATQHAQDARALWEEKQCAA